MRILDKNNDKALKNVIIYLDINEAQELLDSLNDLIQNNDPTQHQHVNDDSYQHEITVVIYDDNKLESLNDRSKKIIKEDI